MANAAHQIDPSKLFWTTDLAVADGGTGASTAAGARTNLGLGSIATQDSNNVTITGGSITGITDLAVADGGTAASTASGARTNLGFADGTYTPTLTNVTNVAASTAYVCQYMRVGNTVTVSGKVSVDPTLGSITTELDMTLPIASASAVDSSLGGVAFCNFVPGQGAPFLKQGSGQARMQWTPTDLGNRNYWFSFTYLVT